MDKEILVASLDKKQPFYIFQACFINKSVLLLAVAIWLVTGQDLQNTK